MDEPPQGCDVSPPPEVLPHTDTPDTPLNNIIMDQDSKFMSSLMNYLFKSLVIKIKQ